MNRMNSNFWVTGTGPGETVVRVDLPYQLGAGTVFSHLDSGAPTQRLVMAEGRSLTASATAQLSWSASALAPQPSPTATPPGATPPTATPASAPVPTATPPAATPAPAEQPTVISERISGAA